MYIEFEMLVEPDTKVFSCSCWLYCLVVILDRHPVIALGVVSCSRGCRIQCGLRR